MINHGKSVLMEKPMCLNKAQSTQLTTAAKDKKVFLMEVKLTNKKFNPLDSLMNYFSGGLVPFHSSL